MSGGFTFFINKNSGAGKSSELARDALLSISELPVKTSAPTSSHQLTENCLNLEKNITRAAVVFGGDGTHSYALRGLIESGIPLYPFPSGTANDLSSAQGIDGSIRQFKDLIQNNSIEEIKVMSANGIPFTTVAGIGIGSALCEEYNRIRDRFPLLKSISQRASCEVYSLLALKQIASSWGKGHRIRIIADAFDRELTVSSVMICNQSTLAGNLNVAPEQSNQEDEFTVLIHPEPCGLSTLRGLIQLRLKNTNAPFIRFKTKRLEIQSLDGSPLKVFGDGEILTESSNLNFQEYPKKLRIFSGNC
jgi:diacylglycerol kinase family enzyme